MSNIGYIYHFGGFGVVKDDGASFTWTKKAADGGDEDAQYRLATMYYDGLGVDKDLAMARIWLMTSSDQGCEDAQVGLGMMMATGEGGARELAKGVTLVEAAAGKGNDTATELLRSLFTTVDASWCGQMR